MYVTNESGRSLIRVCHQIKLSEKMYYGLKSEDLQYAMIKIGGIVFIILVSNGASRYAVCLVPEIVYDIFALHHREHI